MSSHSEYGPRSCTSTSRRRGSHASIRVRHRIGTPRSLNWYSIDVPTPNSIDRSVITSNPSSGGLIRSGL